MDYWGEKKRRMDLTYSDLPDKTLLLPVEVATFLRLSHQSVYRLLEEGKIEGVKTGTRPWRIFRESVIAYLEKQKEKV